LARGHSQRKEGSSRLILGNQHASFNVERKYNRKEARKLKKKRRKNKLKINYMRKKKRDGNRNANG
jgi:hypothetical protein